MKNRQIQEGFGPFGGGPEAETPKTEWQFGAAATFREACDAAWLGERGQHPSRYVFVSQKSGRVHRSQFYRIFSNAAEKAGLPADLV